jgi:hypothetical protein
VGIDLRFFRTVNLEQRRARPAAGRTSIIKTTETRVKQNPRPTDELPYHARGSASSDISVLEVTTQ